jgi:ribosomal protein L39E
MANNKRIGSGYERECAKILSEWFTGNKEDLVCWRTSGSGSVATNRIKKGLKSSNLDGDLQCTDFTYQPFFDKFFLDSKSLTKINFFMTNEKNIKSNKLLNEWIKVVDDAIKNKKIPIMIVTVRDNRTVPDFIVLNTNFRFPPDHKGLSLIVYSFSSKDLKYKFKYDCVLIPQKVFFEKYSWLDILAVN